MRVVFALTGRVLVGDALVEGAVVVDGARIVAVHEAGVGLGDVELRRADVIAPGFIDLQVNGAFGREVGADADAFGHIGRALLRTGVTTWLPTRVTSTADEYRALFAAFAARDPSGPQADALGLHLEGPLLAAAKKGAHRESPMHAPVDLLGLGTDAVRMVTLAPERADALAWIPQLLARGIVVAIGHSAGTHEDVARAADAGATVVTHLYNAMSPFHARAPGVVGQALVDDRLTCTLIADRVHCDDLALELAVRAKGANRVCLVTDAMAGAGELPGRFRLGELDVVTDGSAARLADGTLAGSVLTMDHAVRNMARTSLGLAGALAAASTVPARVLGLSDRGRIAPGLRADLVCLDGAHRVTATYVAGERANAPAIDR